MKSTWRIGNHRFGLVLLLGSSILAACGGTAAPASSVSGGSAAGAASVAPAAASSAAPATKPAAGAAAPSGAAAGSAAAKSSGSTAHAAGAAAGSAANSAGSSTATSGAADGSAAANSAGSSAAGASAPASGAAGGSIAAKPAAAAGAPTGAAEHVKVALTTGSITGAGIYIALERGYFKNAGLDVEIAPFGGGALMISSIAASQVDVADTDPGAGLWNAIGRNLPMRIVADGSRCDTKHCGTAFVVRKQIMDAGGFKTLADLKGKSVAQFQPGSTLYQFLYRMLDKAGLKDTDIKTTNFSAFTDILPAFQNKAVDASWMVEPLTTQGSSKGLFTKYQDATQLFGPQQNTMIVYSPNFASKHQQAGQRFLAAYLHGIRDYLDAVDNGKDYDAIIAILTKDSTLKDPALYKTVGLPGFDANGQLQLDAVKSEVQWFVDHGDIKAPVNVDQVYDPSYLNYAWSVDGKR